MSCVNEEMIAYEKSIEEMKVTMFWGINKPDNGNVNSMGDMIRTKNNELIFDDGGRCVDSELVMFFANKYGNEKVDHWFITHAHKDHVGAVFKLLNEENNL